MTAPRRRRCVTTILWLLPIQLLCGMALVLHAQREVSPRTAVEQKLTDSVETINARLQKLDDLHLEGRLAVLDVLSDRSWRIELLVIGLFLTTGAHLALQAWMHRQTGHRHGHGRFTDSQSED